MCRLEEVDFFSPKIYKMKKALQCLLFVISVLPVYAQWSNNPGINRLVSNRIGAEYEPVSITDGANGSILFFIDNTSNGDIFAQKITSSGTIAWGGTSIPVPISVTTSEKFGLEVIADGSGGAFIAWSDNRHDPIVAEIYLQKLNSAGIVQWAANGLRVTSNTAQDDLLPQMCLDGAGGVIVTWYGDDSTTENIQAYAQRFNGSGIAQWVAGGVQVCTAGGFRAPSGIVADGSNGAIILLLDTRNDPNGFNYVFLNNNNLTNSDIYGQRLNGAGNLQWTANGAAIITASKNQNGDLQSGFAIPDGSGGIIFAFDDERNDDGSITNIDLFAQRVNGIGTPLWAANGVAVSAATGNQFLSGIVPDGAGGLIASIDYQDIFRLYAQRITAAGAPSWAVNGVPVSEVGDQITEASLTADGSGNTIFAFRSFSTNILKAQKLNSAGVLQWATAGATICNNDFAFANSPTIVSSDAGSAIISWSDYRNVALLSGQDIFASKVLTNGFLAGAVSGFATIANGNWNNPAIWAGGVVPPAGAFVQIRHAVIANVNASCATLNIAQPGGNLTVLNGIIISVGN